MKSLQRICCTVLVCLLSGCVQNDKAINAENFQKALSKYYKSQGCVGFSPTHGYPAPLMQGEGFPLRLKESQFPSAGKLDALVNAGLLVTTEGFVKRTVKTREGTKEVWERVRDYRLTESGRKALKQPGSQIFCRHDVEVKKIVSWSEPIQKGDKTFCEVTFELGPVNLAAWANHTEILKAGRNDPISPKPKLVKKMMVLTKEGWKPKDQ